MFDVNINKMKNIKNLIHLNQEKKLKSPKLKILNLDFLYVMISFSKFI